MVIKLNEKGFKNMTLNEVKKMEKYDALYLITEDQLDTLIIEEDDWDEDDFSAWCFAQEEMRCMQAEERFG